MKGLVIVDTELTHDELIALRNELRAYGYDVRLVNIGAFDVHQRGYIHYMGQSEVQALLKYTRKYGVIDNLYNFAERSGLNYWYTFPE